MAQYIALIHKDDSSDFGVSFPDFPGCITAGSTLDEAREMATEALALHLEGMEEDEKFVPEPSSLDQVMTDPENRDGVVLLVPAPDRARSKSARINVMVPVKTLKRIDSYVKLKGYSRSRFLVDAAEKALSAPVKDKVSREVMTDAMRLARKSIRDVLREKNIKISRVPASKITAAAKEVIDADPDILAEAKANIEARGARPKAKVTQNVTARISPELVAASKRSRAKRAHRAGRA